MSGSLGWSYPAGCEDVPFDGGDTVCQMCGKDVDLCVCPECHECGMKGDPYCYGNHGMDLTPEQEKSRKEEEERALDWCKLEAEYEAEYSEFLKGQDPKDDLPF